MNIHTGQIRLLQSNLFDCGHWPALYLKPALIVMNLFKTRIQAHDLWYSWTNRKSKRKSCTFYIFLKYKLLTNAHGLVQNFVSIHTHIEILFGHCVIFLKKIDIESYQEVFGETKLFVVWRKKRICLKCLDISRSLKKAVIIGACKASSQIKQ